jgi:heptaprenyl diphosphate synthase
MGRFDNGRPARRVAFLGLMLALALTLAFFETLLPALPLLPPGVKLGLSNLATMYCLFFLGAAPAFSVAALKAGFVLITRGPVGAFMSLSGGLVSIGAMLLVRRAPGLSVGVVSLSGGVAHNIGQLVAAGILLKSAYVAYYLPVLLLSGVAMGFVTGVLLRIALPYLRHADRTMK